MALMKKALVGCMAALVLWVPVFAQPVLLGTFVPMAAPREMAEAPTTVSQSSLLLPQGDELSDSQLGNVDGEGFIGLVAGAVLGAVGGVIFAPIVYVFHNLIYHDPFSAIGLSKSIVDGAVGGATSGAGLGLLLPEP